MPTGNFVDETLVIVGFTVDVNRNSVAPMAMRGSARAWDSARKGCRKSPASYPRSGVRLGIKSNAAQPLYLNRPVTVGNVKGYVQAAPTGSGIAFKFYVGTAAA